MLTSSPVNNHHNKRLHSSMHVHQQYRVLLTSSHIMHIDNSIQFNSLHYRSVHTTSRVLCGANISITSLLQVTTAAPHFKLKWILSCNTAVTVTSHECIAATQGNCGVVWTDLYFVDKHTCHTIYSFWNWPIAKHEGLGNKICPWTDIWQSRTLTNVTWGRYKISGFKFATIYNIQVLQKFLSSDLSIQICYYYYFIVL